MTGKTKLLPKLKELGKRRKNYYIVSVIYCTNLFIKHRREIHRNNGPLLKDERAFYSYIIPLSEAQTQSQWLHNLIVLFNHSAE